MTVAEVLKRFTAKWMKIHGIIGTGEGKFESNPCIMVFTDDKADIIRKKLPKMVDGYKVILEETGGIKAR